MTHHKSPKYFSFGWDFAHHYSKSDNVTIQIRLYHGQPGGKDGAGSLVAPIYIIVCPLSPIITASAIGGGKISPDGTFGVATGSSQTFTLTPDSGYYLSALTDNSANVLNQVSGNIYTINNITFDHTVIATFDSIPSNTYTLVVMAENGTVSKNPDLPFYSNGTSVTLTAIPATNYRFINWSGDLMGTENPKSITMNGNKSVTANFEFNTYTINTSVPGGNGTATANPAVVNYGGSTTITLDPDTGYYLSALSDNGTDVVNQVYSDNYTINNISANHMVIATFSRDLPNQFTLTINKIGKGTVTRA